jgi:cell division protein FtsB
VTARGNHARRARVTPRAAVLVAITVAVLVYATVPLRIYLQQRAELRDLQAQEQVLQSRTADLTRQERELRDPAHLEVVARECLGMVRPGEIAFVVVPKDGHATPPVC